MGKRCYNCCCNKWCPLVFFIILLLMSSAVTGYFSYLYLYGTGELGLWKQTTCNVTGTSYNLASCSLTCKSNYSNPIICTVDPNQQDFDTMPMSEFSEMGKNDAVFDSSCPTIFDECVKMEWCLIYNLNMQVTMLDDANNKYYIDDYVYYLDVYQGFTYGYNITGDNITCYNNVCPFHTTLANNTAACAKYKDYNTTYIRLHLTDDRASMLFDVALSAAGFDILCICIITVLTITIYRNRRKFEGDIDLNRNDINISDVGK